ncbi:MAG: glycosyltransferase family 2 protein, partial [Bacteroidetes bacterium]|nr:glycosyltransferase family 2 protein [Bacteroidota bacterium]
MPKVSIIIISYNRPDETVDAMKNVLFETDTPKGHELEVVVINNGSTKNYSACEQYVEQLPSEQKTQVKYVNSGENLGVSRGRNLGVDTVTGDYVVFIDDDAVFKSQDALQKLVNTFEAHEEDNVGILALDIENFFTGEPDHPVKNESKLIDDEFYNNIFWGCGFAVRKKVFDE